MNRTELPSLLAVVTSLALFGTACGSSNPVSPQPANSPVSDSQPIESCPTVRNATGRYVLKRDLTCGLFFFGGSGELDCQGHNVQGVWVYDTHDFAVRNCQMGNFVGRNTTGLIVINDSITSSRLDAVSIVGGSGELDCQGQNVEGVIVSDVHDFSIRNCRMQTLTEEQSTAVTIANNTITAPRSDQYVVIGLQGGSRNQIVGNTLDGNWHGEPRTGTAYPPGADDGILIDGESDLVIANNNIRNVWDCGIERVGSGTARTVIENNNIVDANECGIGSWYATGWTDSVFRGNTVVNSWDLLWIQLNGLRPYYGVTSGVFRNNVIENNRILGFGKGQATQGAAGGMVDFVRILGFTFTPPISVSNNVFRNNDFSGRVAPYLAPQSGFIDGGGNICRSGQPTTVIRC